jgi:L-ribulose-5-phosphate 3-epimerase
MENAIKRTKDLGSPILRVFAGWPSHNKEEQWNEMVRCMQVACLLADREGIVLAVENHNHGGFLQTSEDIHRIITDVDSEWLRLNLDTGNYIDGWESIEKTLIYTVQVHAKMMDIQKDGKDFTTDYPAFIKLLREKNYRGFVSLEYEGEEDSLPAVARGVDFLRGLMAENI